MFARPLPLAAALLAATALVPSVRAAGGAEGPSRRPNVLLIYADDQGSRDLGRLGAPDLQTPHLDRLAAGGLTLTGMTAPAPVCSASRVGLLTGRFPARCGVYGNSPLPGPETTLAEVFADAGYRTGHVGKWHLGDDAARDPAGQGFDDWFGHLGGCVDNYSHFFYWNGPNRHDLWDNGREVFRPGEFLPDLMVDRCRQFLDGGTAAAPAAAPGAASGAAPSDGGGEADRPWLLYWAFNSPHYPYQGTPEWREKYRDLPVARREYCAFLSTMDEAIGRVLDHLEQTGQLDDTIVIFQPDHGHSTETRAFSGGGFAGPFRGAKFSLFEGGLRVPAIVRYPARLPAGETRDQFLSGCDWLPTLCELCDVAPPAGTTLDGVSAVSALAENAPLDRPPFYWRMGGGEDHQWAVRDGDWKLIGNPVDTTAPQGERENGGRLGVPLFLANLAEDPGETTNRVADRPEIAARLQAEQDRITAGFGD
ncbi:sulfatase [Alienimonas sp. DA493]|uniref:sulfatase family protein n=1 Tax=Alienimonas sp. DA493 TaxID=3373605 RepID=UPI003754D163